MGTPNDNTLIWGISRFMLDGRNITDFSKIFTLHGYTTSGGAFSTPRRFGATSGFQVPTNYILRILGAIALGSGTLSTTDSHELGYGDTDVGLAGGAAPTNQVRLGEYLDTRSTAAGTMFFTSLDFIIPPSKYPFINPWVGSNDLASALVCELESI